ncbi:MULTISPECIES: GIY-YIG nuclease family protein [Bradyrhizobium]|uniref:GIY-YIG nuclease family protein n=1 Tax=Bradyrhizobium TaxID=374 RepID=UPI00362BE697
MGASNECTDRILRLHSREPALWTLYIGVCNDISSRLTLHRSGRGSKFVKKCGVPRLVYIETYTSPSEAIAREKALKEWHP